MSHKEMDYEELINALLLLLDDSEEEDCLVSKVRQRRWEHKQLLLDRLLRGAHKNAMEVEIRTLSNT
ncbi:hypothetical protein E2C01_058546 [Portunus trituberculatus]|uniref:Uncharacterized protein n=1 Tax=Portunus trituberculatus TaxID=210409 RepID=A0A5B7GVW1_PORTR|nr:hypothetical protein [Portunus trituberculatus]